MENGDVIEPNGIIGIDSRRSHLVAWSKNTVVYQTRYSDLLIPFRDNRYVRS